MVMATVPETSILVVTCSLYVIIWCRIRRDIRQLQLSKQARSQQHSHNAARIMTLFVTAYVAQWSSISVCGIFSFLGEVPEVMDYLVITSTNMGGVFNGIAFLVIQVMRRRQRNRVVPPNTEQRRRQTAATKYWRKRLTRNIANSDCLFVCCWTSHSRRPHHVDREGL